jgi:hypothetical protein
MKIKARATCETGREGKGLMSMSEPVRASRSSCQPGNVARRRKVTKARMMATILQELLAACLKDQRMRGCLQEVGEYDGVFEGRCHPDQVQWILVDVDALRKSSGIVRAQESAVCVCAQPEVSDANFKCCLSNDVGNCCCDTGIDLCRIVIGRVVIVVKVDEENSGNQRRG